jgi:predicted GIY-YIG superfamily endonuclease
MPEERMVKKKSIQVETDVKKTTRETKEQMAR